MKVLYYPRQGLYPFLLLPDLNFTTIAFFRMSLNMGGDDITEFLYVLLERINFPYKDIDLAQSYDWSIMEDLKSRLCTLAEVSQRITFRRFYRNIWQGDVALNLYDFVVRRPDRPAEKYGLRAYDETILAPMVNLIKKF